MNNHEKNIVLVTQKSAQVDDPNFNDLYKVGTVANILQLLKLPDGTVKVLVEGIKRVKILDFKDNEKFITCEFTHYNDIITKDEDLYPLAATALRRLEKLTSINKKISNETINSMLCSDQIRSTDLTPVSKHVPTCKAGLFDDIVQYKAFTLLRNN